MGTRLFKTLQKRVEEIGYISYAHYLESPHWKEFRRSYLEVNVEGACLCCSKKEYQLHHVNYSRLGREELSDVIPLCSKCHWAVHYVSKRFRIWNQNYREAIDIVQSGAYLNNFGKKKLDWKEVSEDSESIPLPKSASELTYKEKILLRACIYLQRLKDRGTFYLSNEDAGHLLSVKREMGRTYLLRLCSLGFLQRLKVGDNLTEQASLYQCTPP